MNNKEYTKKEISDHLKRLMHLWENNDETFIPKFLLAFEDYYENLDIDKKRELLNELFNNIKEVENE